MSVLVIMLIVVCVLIVGGIIGGVVYLIKHRHPNTPCDTTFPPTNGDTKDDYRLWGVTAGEHGGYPTATAEDCFGLCKCKVDGAQGFAFSKGLKNCWCVESPYGMGQHQKWEPDQSWYSGTF